MGRLIHARYWLQCLKWGTAKGWPEIFFLASKILVTDPNGIMVAHKLCDIFFMKKDIRYQYINSFQFNWFFLSITLKFILSLVSQGLGLFKVMLYSNRCAAEIAKTPQCIYCYQMNLNLLVITFSTTLTPLARVVSRNNASPSDGDNKRLVCIRGDQCHDHIKDIQKRVG